MTQTLKIHFKKNPVQVQNTKTKQKPPKVIAANVSKNHVNGGINDTEKEPGRSAVKRVPQSGCDNRAKPSSRPSENCSVVITALF